MIIYRFYDIASWNDFLFIKPIVEGYFYIYKLLQSFLKVFRLY